MVLDNALPEPAGNIPIGVFIATCQSALSISPFTTFIHAKRITTVTMQL